MTGPPTAEPRVPTRARDEPLLRWIQTLGRPIASQVARHPARVDLAVAITISLASVAGLAIQGRLGRLDTIAFCVALCLPLPLRTIDRRLSFALVAAVALAQWLVSTPQLADAAVLWALFWVALDGSMREIALAGIVVEAGAIMAALRWSPDEPAKVWVGITGLIVAAGAVGLVIRERRALIASMRERAARLEFERDQEGRLGAATERARIAREMHDIVSHNLTVMIGLADGADYALDTAPQSARAAMNRVSETGRQALREMRRLLGVLRDEPGSGPLEPQPGIDRLDDLLAQVEAAGVPVSIELAGDPHVLSSGVALAVYRVAQEALTNTLKHAGRPVSAHLGLSCTDDAVRLVVTDTGAASSTAATRGSASAGRGLRGMRERAAAYDGQLEAGPLPGGGWRVALTLSAEVGAPEARRP